MDTVAPFTGAWIEISLLTLTSKYSTMSLPSRGRGLKFDSVSTDLEKGLVAPFTGAWIEIPIIAT